MEYFYAASYFFLCVFCVVAMLKRSDGSGLILGVLSLFSIGYYVLPVFFKIESGLEWMSSDEISLIVWMCLLFFISIVVGYELCLRCFDKKEMLSIDFKFLDAAYSSRYTHVFWVGFIVWVVYFFKVGTTSYAADDFEAFFHERGPLDGLLAAVSGFGLSAMAVSIALSVKWRGIYKSSLMLFVYLTCVIFLLSSGQRLSVITPIFTLAAALFLFGERVLAIRSILSGIVVLVVISPLMVFVREFQGAKGSGKVLSAASDYSLGDGGVVSSLVASIMQRADLIEVCIYLKKHIDNVGYVAGEYYRSVAFSFVPKFIYPDKPYPLSDDGTIWGEISVVAWRLLQGNTTGSLSAFGAITAYREGGWFWLPVNGVLTGVSMFLLYKMLARGGAVGKLVFCTVFVSICVKVVPPSLFEFWVSCAAYLNVILFLVFFNLVLKVLNKDRLGL